MRNAYAAMGAVVGWGALGLQLALIVTVDGDPSLAWRTINLLSSFTVLSNIMAATALTVAAVGAGGSRLFGFFMLPTVQTGIAVYITVTGIAYLIVLRTISGPEGWAFVAEAILYYVMPLFYVGFWLLFVAKGTLRIGDIVGFLGFPVLYVAYSLVRGPIIHWYPYSFLDVGDAGIGHVAINVAAMSAAFALVGLAYIAIDRVLGGPPRRMAVS
ncbi:MAG: Pr6Pr family membrane protein [Bauldia sp.]|nr:Pr6Pr family membrane protein [Bauldia sp.]